MAEQENMSVMDFDAIQEKRTDELMQLLDDGLAQRDQRRVGAVADACDPLLSERGVDILRHLLGDRISVEQGNDRDARLLHRLGGL